MSRKPSSKTKLQADSYRELEEALNQEATRLEDLGYRNFPPGTFPKQKDWLTPNMVLNWIVAGYFRLDPAAREQFAAGVGREEVLRLMESDRMLYYQILRTEEPAPAATISGKSPLNPRLEPATKGRNSGSR